MKCNAFIRLSGTYLAALAIPGNAVEQSKNGRSSLRPFMESMVTFNKAFLTSVVLATLSRGAFLRTAATAKQAFKIGYICFGNVAAFIALIGAVKLYQSLKQADRDTTTPSRNPIESETSIPQDQPQQTNLTSELQNQSDTIEELRSEVFERMEELRTLREENTRLNGQIDNCDEQIRDRDEQITRLGAEVNRRDEYIAQQDTQITRLTQEVRQRDTQISQRDTLISQRNTQISQLRDQVGQSNTQISQLRDQVGQSNRQITLLTGQINDRDRQITQLNGQIRAALGNPLDENLKSQIQEEITQSLNQNTSPEVNSECQRALKHVFEKKLSEMKISRQDDAPITIPGDQWNWNAYFITQRRFQDSFKVDGEKVLFVPLERTNSELVMSLFTSLQDDSSLLPLKGIATINHGPAIKRRCLLPYFDNEKYTGLTDVLEHGQLAYRHSTTSSSSSTTSSPESQKGPKDSLHIFKNILSGILELHQNGIIHGHIDPFYVYIPRTDQGTLQFDASKLLFQSSNHSKFFDLEPQDFNKTASSWTYRCDFIPPERLGSTDKIHPQTDIYAAVLILASCLSSKPQTPSDAQTILAVSEFLSEYKHPEKVEMQISMIAEGLKDNIDESSLKDACEFFRSCLDFHPEKRPSALQAILKVNEILGKLN